MSRCRAQNLWRCDPKIPLDVLSCSDPLGNAVHTALAFDLVGEDVLITGAGPIGCMAVPIAKMAGARKVVITDVNPYRLDLARRMGATLAIDVRERNLHDAMHELEMREGFDVGLEMSGNPKAFTDMLDVMVNGGRIAMLGIMPGSAAIDWNLVVFHGLTIKGIYGREMFETWYKMTALIQSGLDISPVITHRFPAPRFSGRLRTDEVREFRENRARLGSASIARRRFGTIAVVLIRGTNERGVQLNPRTCGGRYSKLAAAAS